MPSLPMHIERRRRRGEEGTDNGTVGRPAVETKVSRRALLLCGGCGSRSGEYLWRWEFDVARVLSIGRDRATGQAVPRFRDERGRIVAVRLRPRQFRTLANGVLGLAEALEEEGER